MPSTNTRHGCIALAHRICLCVRLCVYVCSSDSVSIWCFVCSFFVRKIHSSKVSFINCLDSSRLPCYGFFYIFLFFFGHLYRQLTLRLKQNTFLCVAIDLWKSTTRQKFACQCPSVSIVDIIKNQPGPLNPAKPSAHQSTNPPHHTHIHTHMCMRHSNWHKFHDKQNTTFFQTKYVYFRIALTCIKMRETIGRTYPRHS